MLLQVQVWRSTKLLELIQRKLFHHQLHAPFFSEFDCRNCVAAQLNPAELQIRIGINYQTFSDLLVCILSGDKSQTRICQILFYCKFILCQSPTV